MSKTEALKGRRRTGATRAAGARPRARTVAARWLGLPAFTVPLALGLIAVLFAVWQAVHVRGYTYTAAAWIGGHGWSDYDEGVYLVSARLLNHGYAIFSQVFSSQPPLFLAGLAVFLRMFGNAAGAGHLYSLACGLLALGGVAWLCWETVGRWSALLAVAVLAVSPGFVIASHAVEAEAPMMAFSSLAVASAARYARTANRWWLVGASFLVAAATLSKLLAVAAAVPLGIAILLCAVSMGRPSVISRLVQDTAIAILCVGVPIAGALLLLSPAQQWDQVVRFHLEASKAVPNAVPVSDTFATFLGWDPGLLALAVAGLGAVAALRCRLGLIQISWLLATYLSMARYNPLFIHHLTVLLPPLAALAGGALAVADLPHTPHLRRWAAILLLAVGLVVYAIWLPSTLDRAAGAFVPDDSPLKAARVGWLSAHSGPNDMVMVDDQTLAVAANRLVPPALSDTSIVRSRAGYLPLSLLEQGAADPRVRAVLLTRALLYDGGYVSWLSHHYRQVPNVPQLGGAMAFVRVGHQ